MEQRERRQHSRIQLSLSIKLSGPKGEISGELRDVGFGGAGVLIQEKNCAVNDSVELILPLSGLSGRAIQCKVVRIQKGNDGFLIGLQFIDIEKDLNESLLLISDFLIDSAGRGSRKYARVARRIPVKYGSALELKALVENISMGGMNMIVESEHEKGEILEIAIAHPKTHLALHFRGRVIYSNPLSGDQKGLTQVGLEFEELSKGEKKRLRQLLKAIVQSTQGRINR